MWNTLKRIGVWTSQLFEPTLWELRIFAAEHALNNATAKIEELRAQLAQAEIELADKAFYVREFAAVSQERDGLKAEIATLRERASVPVPAGVPSVEELGALARNVWKKLSINEGRWLKWEDAPELDKQRFTAIGSAIRDAVLAGVAGGAPLPTKQRMTENQGYSTAPPAIQTPLLSTIEVLNFDPPAYECKECAKCRKANEDLRGVYAARAALEGE